MRYACQACGRPCGAQFPCEQCTALLYCSSKHRRLHRSHGGHDTEECNRMAQQVAAAPVLDAELASFFPWWWQPEHHSPLPLIAGGVDQKSERLQSSFSRDQAGQHDKQQQQQQQQQLQCNQDPVCQLLQHYGQCHMQGVWCALCPCAARSRRATIAKDWKGSQDRPAAAAIETNACLLELVGCLPADSPRSCSGGAQGAGCSAGAGDVSSEGDLGEENGGGNQGLPWGASNPPTLLLQPPPLLLPYPLNRADPTAMSTAVITSAATMHGPCQGPSSTNPTALPSAHTAVHPAAAALPSAHTAVHTATAAHGPVEPQSQPLQAAPPGLAAAQEQPVALRLPERGSGLSCSGSDASHLPSPAHLPKGPLPRLQDWASCYALLGLRQHSLHALVLHFVATLARALQQLHQPASSVEGGVGEEGAGCASCGGLLQQQQQQHHGKQGMLPVQQQLEEGLHMQQGSPHLEQEGPHMQRNDLRHAQQDDPNTQQEDPHTQRIHRACPQQQQQQQELPLEHAEYNLAAHLLEQAPSSTPPPLPLEQHILYLGPQCELDMLDTFSALPHLFQPALSHNSFPPSLTTRTPQARSFGLSFERIASSPTLESESPAHLYPSSPPAPCQLHIHFIGPQVPPSWHGHSSSFTDTRAHGTNRAASHESLGTSFTGSAHSVQLCASVAGRQAPGTACESQLQLRCSFWHGCLHEVAHDVRGACGAEEHSPQGHDHAHKDHWQAQGQELTGAHQPQQLQKRRQCSCSDGSLGHHQHHQQQQQQQHVRADLCTSETSLLPSDPLDTSTHPSKRARLAPQQQQQQQRRPDPLPSPEVATHPAVTTSEGTEVTGAKGLQSKRLTASPTVADTSPLRGPRSLALAQECRGASCSVPSPLSMSASATPGCVHGQLRHRHAGAPWGNVMMIFAPNAGIAAYPSWLPTLELLAVPGSPPLVVTDFCEEALVKSQQLVQTLLPNLRVVQPVFPNPLRQPLRQTTHGNKLPAYNNGFSMVLQAETPRFNATR